MRIVVQKYGGSSVADLGRLRAVAERVVRTADRDLAVVVVVSAMGKTTDELLALARSVSPSPPRRELDMLLTCGERISMSLLCMAIQSLGRPAISFTGSQSGIITDERHAGARIVEVRPHRIREELERGKIVVVAGFQGVSLGREITTLGRGGSDTSAVALAAALGAESCEICSDVDGVLSGDPRVVPEARRIEEMSCEEMEELAVHGAKVLNPQAVAWARRAGIVISAVASAGGAGGTRVVPHGRGRQASLQRAAGPRRITGVTGSRDVVRVTLRGTDEDMARLGVALAEDGIATRMIDASPGQTRVCFGQADIPDWPAVRGRLVARFPAALEIEEDIGSVSVVGEGVGEDATLLDEMRAACAAAGAGIRGLHGTPLRMTVLTDVDRIDDLTRRLHRTLLEADSPEEAEGQRRLA